MKQEYSNAILQLNNVIMNYCEKCNKSHKIIFSVNSVSDINDKCYFKVSIYSILHQISHMIHNHSFDNHQTYFTYAMWPLYIFDFILQVF